MRLAPRRAALAGLLVLLPAMAGSLAGTPAFAGTAGAGAAARPAAPVAPHPPAGGAEVPDPDGSLPKGWRSSGDRAVTTAGDGLGFHVLAADSAQAYRWRTVASLAESGFETDLWVGNSCVTASGKRAAVVYAPRQFTNKPELMQRGAFAAIVDLESGAVTKLPEQVSLAYFDPGCGAGETVVFTQGGDADLGKTRLLVVDAATGKTVDSPVVPGQFTSAVPVQDGVVGARGAQLTRVDRHGQASALAKTSGAAFSIHPDAEGGITFLDHDGESAQARRYHGGAVSTLAHGKLGGLGVQAGTAGRVFLTGSPEGLSSLPRSVKAIAAAPDAVVSSTGGLAVDQAVSGAARRLADQPLAPPKADGAAAVEIQAEVPGTGKKLSFSAPSAADHAPVGDAVSPALGKAGVTPKSTPRASASLSSTGNDGSTVDLDATCAVERNSPALQSYQPTPGQVEWAVDMAVRGNLTSNWIRQGGWRNLAGLGTVDPQGMFPLPALAGGGHIPPQVLLGILAQESNLWQAEGGAIPGQFGNPLVGGFYGHPKADPNNPQAVWQIDWSKVDCGYGIGQQTDGMHSASVLRPGDQAWPADQQQAIALDYASNIAVAARTLSNKWNELHDPNAPMKVNSDNPASIENWFTAAWDYNAGFTRYSPSNPTAPWGLGYLNNPVNPLYPAGRAAFLDNNHYADAAQPQKWPYEEKVLGWAAWPINTGRSYDDNGNLNGGNPAGYAAAWWVSAAERTAIKPPLATFCNTTNNCDPGNPPPCEINHLGASCDTPYWYHSAAVWKDCVSNCGHETMTYKTLRSEPGNGTTGAPDCKAPGSAGAPPSGSLIVDSVSGGIPPFRSDCTRTWSNAGTLSFNFLPDSAGHYEAKADLHQIGGGFGAHFWYAHTRSSGSSVISVANNIHQPTQAAGPMAITGTWKLSQPLNAWTKVFVHLPDTGSQTRQAIYTVHLGDGTTENRVVNVNANTNQWVSLGVFHFVAGSDIQGVELSNFTQDGTGAGGDDIAWDAAAFQPLPAKPADFVVALGDSYSSGEGTGNYYYNSDVNGANAVTRDACHRSPNAWSRQAVLADSGSSIGARADQNDATMDYHLIACGGARVNNVLSVDSPRDAISLSDKAGGFQSGQGQNGEIAQLDQGFLDANTTLVTISIGGNDAKFSDIVTKCVTYLVLSDCSTLADDETGAPLAQAEPKLMNSGVHDSVVLALTEIHKRAPNARIVLMGYPPLFENHGSCLSGRLDTATISAFAIGGPTAGVLATLVDIAASVHIGPDADWMDQLGFTLDSSMRDAVGVARAAGVPATFSDPTAAFAGKAICGSPQSINDFVINKTPGENPGKPFSGQSFHPLASGAYTYSLALNSTLRSLGL
ncbi:SGNH/GDSL hydrolase family protein [Kitasatospora sp. NPDC002227]|uniref:golvesin C-terminal-like domain-containing protein n=1 Tax=Kitasatospora sp. NPDC002227 TaxID=3154773 RepID=UPI003333DAF2